MTDLKFELETSHRSMGEIRPSLDAALGESFSGGWMEGRWEGEVLHLSGPGAQGTVRYEAGRLVGEARLRPPASLLRPLIEKKVLDVLQKAAT